ncbi:MAG: hypothetical protein ACRDJU_06915 [Actinomycetota bacterium]
MAMQPVRGTTSRPRERGGEEHIAIAFREAADRLGSTLVPNPVLEDARLDPAARLAYALLLRQAATPDGELSVATLGASLGLPAAQALDCLRALLDAGLLSVAERRADGQPSALCLEPLSRRYGREAAAAARAAGSPVPRLRELPERSGVAEPRGAVIPLMTEQRRAYEDRLAARIPVQSPVRAIDPGLRELGLAQARRLRAQLRPEP